MKHLRYLAKGALILGGVGLIMAASTGLMWAALNRPIVGLPILFAACSWFVGYHIYHPGGGTTRGGG